LIFDTLGKANNEFFSNNKRAKCCIREK